MIGALVVFSALSRGVEISLYAMAIPPTLSSLPVLKSNDREATE